MANISGPIRQGTLNNPLITPPGRKLLEAEVKAQEISFSVIGSVEKAIKPLPSEEVMVSELYRPLLLNFEYPVLKP